MDESAIDRVDVDALDLDADGVSVSEMIGPKVWSS